ncbi:MAG: hypothetical protein ACR2H3_02855 [Acidimicrobiales bacterium]
MPATVATIRGLDDFEGVTLHGPDAVDRHAAELRGARVGLLGDPVIIARLVAPLAAVAGRLKVFQDAPVWVLPRTPLGPLRGTVRSALDLAPRGIRRRAAAVIANRHRGRGVPDGWTRRQLTPRRPPTRRSIVYSNSYYRTLRLQHVELITWPVAGVVREGVRTADGLEHHVDVVVLV